MVPEVHFYWNDLKYDVLLDAKPLRNKVHVTNITQVVVIFDWPTQHVGRLFCNALLHDRPDSTQPMWWLMRGLCHAVLLCESSKKLFYLFGCQNSFSCPGDNSSWRHVFSWVESVLRRFQILLWKLGACSVSIATATFLLVHWWKAEGYSTWFCESMGMFW